MALTIQVEPVFAGCTGKQRFTTFKGAERVAKRQRRQDKRIQAYRCLVPGCAGFHVGEGFEQGQGMKAKAAAKRRRVRRLEEVE